MKPRPRARRATRQPRPPGEAGRVEPTKAEILEQELEGCALRAAAVLCEVVIVTFRYARRPVVVRVPGSAAAYRTTRPRAETTVRFVGPLAPELERELRWLLPAPPGVAPLGAARGGALRPRAGGARLDIVLADGRSYRGCGIDVPLEAEGELAELNFRLRHRAL